MDHSPPGSFVHGNLQARILESVTIFFSRGSSWARDRALSSWNAGGFFTTEPPGKPFVRNISSQGPFLTTSLHSILFFFLVALQIVIKLCYVARNVVSYFTEDSNRKAIILLLHMITVQLRQSRSWNIHCSNTKAIGLKLLESGEGSSDRICGWWGNTHPA